LVIAMLHKADFFQEQIDQCRPPLSASFEIWREQFTAHKRLVAQASNKNDREFWLQMTHAANALLDRGWGKAAQLVAVDGEIRQLVEVRLNVVRSDTPKVKTLQAQLVAEAHE